MRVVALALIERIAWGSLGTGLALIPRVVAASFAAYAGLGMVKYVAGYAALLATAWSPDFTNLSNVLIHNVAVSDAVAQSGGCRRPRQHLRPDRDRALTQLADGDGPSRAGRPLCPDPHRHCFVPLVCVLSIWPRLAGTASTMAEFLIGLLLSKFVVATAVYVGFRLVVVALVSPTDTDTTENWMASGVAVLLIAAFSPIVIFSALRFAHSQAGSAARNLTGAAVSMAPAGWLLKGTGKSLRSIGAICTKATRRWDQRAQVAGMTGQRLPIDLTVVSPSRRGEGSSEGEPAPSGSPNSGANARLDVVTTFQRLIDTLADFPGFNASTARVSPQCHDALLLDASEAAKLLSISRAKVCELANQGEIPSIRLGRSLRIPREPLIAWVNDRTAEPDWLKGRRLPAWSRDERSHER